MKRTAALVGSIIFVLATPAMSAIDWVADGIRAHLGSHDLIDAPVVVAGGGGSVYTVSRHFYGPMNVHVLVQKIDRCGQRLWGDDGVTADDFTAPAWEVSATPDGVGGVIVAWAKGGTADIYAQRFDANGTELWPSGGVIVAGTTDDERLPMVTTDSAEGCIVVWENQTGPREIYAQRIDAAGNPMWAANGVRITTNVSNEYLTGLIEGTSGSGSTSAIVSFYTGAFDHAVQKIDGFGNAVWSANGKDLGVAGNGNGVDMTTNSLGGAWLAYESPDAAANRSIHVVHVDFSGAIIGTYDYGSASQDDYGPSIAYVGVGEVHLAWTQNYFGDQEARVRQIGEINTYILANDPFSDQKVTDLVYDGDNGSVVVWEDARNGNADIYAARFTGSGFSWANGSFGIPICTNTGNQSSGRVALARLGYWTVGDLYFAWVDDRSLSQTRVYVQRVDGVSGVWGHPEPKIVATYDCDAPDEGGCLSIEWIRSQVDGPLYPIDPPNPVVKYTIWRAVDVPPMYPPDPVCPGTKTGGASQMCEWEMVAEITATGAENYFANVPTTRDVAPGDPAMHYFAILGEDELGEYYVSAIDSGASEDDIAPTPPVEPSGEQIGSYVYLSWLPSTAPDVAHYKIYRALGLARYTLIGMSADPNYTDETAGGSTLDRTYAISAVDDNGNEGTKSAPVVVLANPTGVDDPTGVPSALRVLSPSPNPFRGSTNFQLGLPADREVAIDVFNARGQRVHSERRGRLNRGWHTLTFDGRTGSRRLPSGVYFFRVQSGAETVTRKMVIAR